MVTLCFLYTVLLSKILLQVNKFSIDESTKYGFKDCGLLSSLNLCAASGTVPFVGGRMWMCRTAYVSVNADEIKTSVIFLCALQLSMHCTSVSNVKLMKGFGGLTVLQYTADLNVTHE